MSVKYPVNKSQLVNCTRRLTTANKSRVSICVTQKFGGAGGTVEPVKVFLSSSLITIHNLVAVSYHVGACRSQKVEGAAAPLP